MKRRSFLKAVGLTAGTLAGASCVPKGEVMPQIGDLFAKLALGQQLTSGEIEDLRLGMNQQQNATSRLSALLTPSGNLDPNIFSHHAGEFSVLPHEAAGMAIEEEFSGQAIPNTTVTQIKPFETSAQLPTRYQAVDFEYGIKRDLANGEFIIPRCPDAVYIFHAHTDLTGATITDGHLLVREKENSAVFRFGDGESGSSNDMQGCVIIQGRPSESRWQLEIYQSSGATRNLYSAYWSVVRLR